MASAGISGSRPQMAGGWLQNAREGAESEIAMFGLEQIEEREIQPAVESAVPARSGVICGVWSLITAPARTALHILRMAVRAPIRDASSGLFD